MSKLFKLGIIYVLMLFIGLFDNTLFFWVPDKIMMLYGNLFNMLFPTLVIVILLKDHINQRLKLKRVGISTLVYCMLLLIVIIPLKVFGSEFTQFLLGNLNMSDEGYISIYSGSLIRNLLFIAFIPAICEELLFRGLLIDLNIGKNMHILAITNGLMFSMFHLGYDQLLYTFISGTIYAYIAIITGSILPTIVMHFIGNAIVVWSVHSSGINEKIVATPGSGLHIVIISGILSLVCVVFVVKILRYLIEKYNIDDQKRVLELKDTQLYDKENVLISYLPIFVVALFVLWLNIGLIQDYGTIL